MSISNKGPFDGQDKEEDMINISYPILILSLMRQWDMIIYSIF
jgi:hypothetical protein